MKELIPQEHIESKIYIIRGAKVMLDRDLAEMYGVETKQLKRQVRRNMERFPLDFMFELTNEEFSEWRCQFGTSNITDKMGLRYRPFAFTEHGVAMLSSVLNSKRAIAVNIIIIRAFMKLREMIALNKGMAQKLSQLERKYERHDEQIHAIFDQIREFMTTPEKPKKPIGFKN
jgi:phage regulator Rha-like protein